MPKISVIIPVRDDETAYHSLIEFFEMINDSDFEVIVAKGKNRANAMNQGAEKANTDFLWFIHADTKLDKNHVNALKEVIEKFPDRLHYFDLAFDQKGIISLNSLGANIRSRLFGLPWGDQAFCLSKDNFLKLSRYDETAPYGEDHLLVWKAHQQKIKLNRIPIAVITSAREYQKKGWLKLTLVRQYLWMKQAIPEFVKWIKS